MQEINKDELIDLICVAAEQQRIEADEIAMQIATLSPLMPIHVLQDVDKRIADWLAQGGTHTDNYIKQQVRYMQNVAQALGHEVVP